MRAIVIGDAMVDTYLWGNVERISPEAPIPVVSVNRRERRLGGAANVAINLQSLGATPVLFSIVGNDENGQCFKKMIAEKELPVDGIFEDSGRPTTVKSRIIGKGQHIARVDEESTGLIHAELEQQIARAVLQEIERNGADVVLFVDYDKGLITPGLFETISNFAREKKIPVAVDPKKRNFNLFRDVDLFKPNFYEFLEGTGVQLKKGDLKGLENAARDFKWQQNIKYIFVTLSELGVFVSNGEEQQYSPAVIREIADVSGAGDSVLSVVSLALAAKLTSSQMALMANLAGGLVCESPGVVPVDKLRLMKMMKSEKI
ncbi:rfaE bifunctional protein, domain I [Mariniphaga anaerophila]|uniref:RfaE bifunctional protein, domain I n=1 Tax=Mariniphaga anaerophila TaxID=1484053 RepID=A0A1M5AI94_9BACT|nr:bifunctional ADP-heptose synthase [Mariniphaga anaerophila]SHF29844.1 rfaE bifunctional protein, domain I [Mariniphaga anaerophila]